MVFAFLCHSVPSTPCRILYSVVYGDDMQAAISENMPVETLRQIRKEQLMQIACRVQSEYGFRRETKHRIPRGHIKDDGSSDSHSLEKGLFRLSAGDPFISAKSVLWIVHDNCAFVMVCDSDENRLQADNVLTYIVLTIRDHVMNMDQKMAEIMLKGEWLSAVLHLFLPNGQLVFMNHKLIKQLEKQLDSILSSK